LSAGSQERVVADLVSLGVEGTGDFALGPHDVAFDAAGNLKVIVGLGGDPAVRDPSGPLGAQGINFAQLVAVAADGTWTNQVDIGAYEAANNPDGGLPDTNPFGLLRVDDGYVVADAGANALLHITDAGVITTLAVFPDQMVEFPPGSGDMVPMQAVPTSVTIGPDGAYYVGQLTGFPFPVDGANIYRVEPGGGEPEIYASGFTNITDVTFDPYGNLFVVEIFTNGFLSGDPTGAVIQVLPDDSRVVLASEGLVNPSGVTVGPDGALYVTNFGTAANEGQVVRIVPAPQGNFEVVAVGLNNPRGLVFGPGGGLYVAEAGIGGDGACIPTPEGISCFGTSGSVTRLLAGPQERVVDDLVSLGVEGTGDFALGPHDVAFDAAGNLKVIVGLGGDPAVRDPSGPLGAQGINFAQLVAVAADGT
jgi:sugar lactone lactonase YvrE